MSSPVKLTPGQRIILKHHKDMAAKSRHDADYHRAKVSEHQKMANMADKAGDEDAHYAHVALRDYHADQHTIHSLRLNHHLNQAKDLRNSKSGSWSIENPHSL